MEPDQENSNESQIQIFSNESNHGFTADLQVSNEYLKRINEVKLTLNRNKIFWMPSPLQSVMNKAFQRKNKILYCISTKEISVDISEAAGEVYLPLLTENEIKGRLQSLDPKTRSSISMVHIGAIKILLKAQFRNGINSPVKIALIDNRIINRKDCLLGAAKENLAYGKFMFTIYPKFGLSIKTQRLNQTLSLIHEFSNKDLMKKGDKVFSLTYLVGYALSNSHHSIDFKSNDMIELEDIFQEIGNVHQSEFCEISDEENNWAINIAQEKRLMGSTQQSITNNTLTIGQPSSQGINQSEITQLTNLTKLIARKQGFNELEIQSQRYPPEVIFAKDV